MDPLSALSIAAAVVQFVDFGYRLVKSAHQLYTSPGGQKLEDIELSIVSRDLSNLADAVQAKLDDNAGPQGDVLRLCCECASTNTELQEILAKLKARGDTKLALAADICRVTLRQVATAGDIEKLAGRLSGIRQQMNVALLYLLLDEAGKSGVELRQFAKQQADMIATLDRVDSTTKQFSTDIAGLIDKLPVDNRSEVDEMVRYVLSDKWDASEYAKRTQVDSNKDGDKVDKVCQSLYFESVGHREISISKRHANTFALIFHEPRTSEDGHPLWSSFPQWLQEDSQDIYWITGKPGAGKSTLVKFFAYDRRFAQLLRNWADGSQLLVARFFSWTSGANKLQKSHEGLFRTLLLEVIRQREQLAIDIFPARWFLLQSFDGNVKLPAPTVDELVVGFQNLLRATGDNLKLAVVIDGLDEFDEDHRQVVQILGEANAAAAVKVCASSRPWNVFRDAYGKNPMLRLENLTREDIKSFVQGQLELSPGYHEFAATNPQIARNIITDIVNKSQGVFLWVSVISGILEVDFREGASITSLQAVLDKLPSEVADLFRYIWHRTGKRFRAEASQLFQVKNFCQELGISLPALDLWFGDKDIPVDLGAAEVTSEYLTGAINSLERKLTSRTGGLLELVSIPGPNTGSIEDSLVDFMHRTALDWVRENWASITAATDPGFDPRLSIVKGAILNIVLTPVPIGSDVPGSDRFSHVLRVASLFPDDHPDKKTIVTTLDRLDIHVSRISEIPRRWWETQLRYGRPSHLADKRLPHRYLETPVGCMAQVAALVPIPIYLNHKLQADPSLLSTQRRYGEILKIAIFGEILFNHRTGARLELLKFFAQEQYRSWLDQIQISDRTIHEGIKYVISNDTLNRGDNYWTQVLYVLEPRTVSDGGDVDAQRGGGSSQDPKPGSKWRGRFQVSFRRIFTNKSNWRT
ncbi:hypothetical protein F5144DRAFT_570116 [Chaetomium tenue]|uniref:Uncharacterized protein n=1 Tax=Chaetomium tenue TaxID=1854479 RepID=A0ACB7PDX6_9PEZI|nr:hypothetical protein F5144DRAFT_570116 [Chaetomium globosum]